MQLKQNNSKMKLKINEEKQNPLFNRKEIEGEIQAEIVPKKQEVIGELSKKFSVQEDAIKIKGIKGKFGTKIFKIKANIYTSKEERDGIEVKTKKEKRKAEEGEKK